MKRERSKAADGLDKKFEIRGSDIKDGDGEAEFIEDIVKEVNEDFASRCECRRHLEAQWQLNSNFVTGNQYCTIGIHGEIEDVERDFFWQEREVFNHLAPIIETRLAKLQRVRPKMSVRPFSSDDDDIKTSKLSSKILNAAWNKLDMSQIVAKATGWSELAGSVFYKIRWNESGGKKVGRAESKDIFEGEVAVDVCPPYEIYPSSLTAESIEDLTSIIHAKAIPAAEVKRLYGVDAAAEKIDVLCAHSLSLSGGLGYLSTQSAVKREEQDGLCLVIERYSRPNEKNPDGELVIVTRDKLLYKGPLPYFLSEDGKKEFPFVKQDSISVAGSFFGVSVIERAIPIQRAYNAVKNRKHEFLNRISMGVLAVEDGSVDMDNLAEEGLSPGKVLVYRQGATPPRLMDPGNVPNDFTYEEDRLLNEFISISGVSEIMRSSAIPSALTSGVALQMLIEQDDTRLSVTAENIRSGIKTIAKYVLRLYKEFVLSARLSRVVGEGGEAEILAWTASDISCDDVVFDTENELNTTPASRQNMMFELLRMGLLTDENGKLSNETRYKVLDNLGYGGWEVMKDITALHVLRAEKENELIHKEIQEVTGIDDHNMHIDCHIKYFLSEDFAKLSKKHIAAKQALLEHIERHKAMMQPAAEEISNE